MKKTLATALGGIMVFALLAVFTVSQRAHAQGDNGDHQSGGTGSSVTVTNSHDEQGQQGEMGDFENQSEWKGAHGLGLSVGQESAIVRPNGDFRITGATVNSVDTTGGTVNATLFGLSKNVNLSGATITGGGQTISLGDIKAGDKVDATGNYNATAHTATISQVIDLSYSDRHTADIQSQIQHLLQLVQQLQAQLQALQGQ